MGRSWAELALTLGALDTGTRNLLLLMPFEWLATENSLLQPRMRGHGLAKEENGPTFKEAYLKHLANKYMCFMLK